VETLWFNEHIGSTNTTFRYHNSHEPERDTMGGGSRHEVN